MSAIHTALGWPVVAANIFASLWALVAHWSDAARTRVMWVVISVAQAMIFAQAFIGAAALSSFEGERPGFHLFYGFLALTGVLLLYAYRSYEQLTQYRYLLYGIGGLFISGLLIRTVLLQR